MIWYTAHYGSWRDSSGVKRVMFPMSPGNGERLGTFSHRQAMETAQAVADRVGQSVTVEAEIPMPCGYAHRRYEVKPGRVQT